MTGMSTVEAHIQQIREMGDASTIQGIVYAIITSDGSLLMGWATSGAPVEAYGAAMALTKRIEREFFEEGVVVQ